MTTRIYEPTNIQRAQWAKAALTVFTKQTHSGEQPDTMHPGDLEDAVADVICDLLHFAQFHPTMDPVFHARAFRLLQEETAVEEVAIAPSEAGTALIMTLRAPFPPRHKRRRIWRTCGRFAALRRKCFPILPASTTAQHRLVHFTWSAPTSPNGSGMEGAHHEPQFTHTRQLSRCCPRFRKAAPTSS